VPYRNEPGDTDIFGHWSQDRIRSGRPLRTAICGRLWPTSRPDACSDMTELAQNSQMAEGKGPLYMGKELMRLCAKDPDVQTFLEECLVPLCCPGNSAQGLYDFPSETLGQLGETRRIHPNRLHTLLSNDVSKGVTGRHTDQSSGPPGRSCPTRLFGGKQRMHFDTSGARWMSRATRMRK
jgi:hypothetical protein